MCYDSFIHDSFNDQMEKVYVTTRNDTLASVIEKCPPARKSDLVFYGQNGYIEDYLKEQVLYLYEYVCVCSNDHVCTSSAHRTFGKKGPTGREKNVQKGGKMSSVFFSYTSDLTLGNVRVWVCA